MLIWLPSKLGIWLKNCVYTYVFYFLFIECSNLQTYTAFTYVICFKSRLGTSVEAYLLF